MWDFLKANPVVLGAVIAIVPILISNVVQIILHVIDIRQKNKEAKIQAREKWTEPDVLSLMDSVKKLISLFSEVQSLIRHADDLEHLMKTDVYTEDELKAQRKSIFEKTQSSQDEMHQTIDSMARLAGSFDGE